MHRAPRLVALSLLLLLVATGFVPAQDDVKAKIAVLEKKLGDNPRAFDWATHNELRHLYGGFDERKALYHCDIIFRHSPMDAYTLDVLGARGADKEKEKAVAALLRSATKYPEYPFVAAACWLKAAEVCAEDALRSQELLRRVAALKGDGLDRYRALAAARLDVGERPVTKAPWTIPVLVINYFPLTEDRKNIDLKVTANVGSPVVEIEAKCLRMTGEVIQALEDGSRFRPYRNPAARPSLHYTVVDTVTFYEPVPHHLHKKNYTDYNKVLERVKIRDWVEKKGVREVWIWGYHSKEIGPVESNLASIHGNVSNSMRDPLDLPILKHSYTVYHYNYERNAAMAVHNHLHQIEALMRHHGGELWQTFEGKPGAWRCGNCHFPVNGAKDYDYANKNFVMSDIEDWKPEGLGATKRINCDRWNGDDLKWYVYWMQSMPGADNGLTFKGRPLGNWWEFTGDYDQAVRRKSKLTD